MNAEIKSRKPRKLLLVDDDEAFRHRLQRAFADRGLEVREASGVRDALEKVKSFGPEWILVDLKMADGSGLDVVEQVAKSNPAIKIVVLTGYGSIATALQAVRQGAFNYLTKPIDADRILASFEKRDEEIAEKPVAAVPSLDAVEWEHIQRVLADCEGNISKAAKLLGIERRSLQRKLAKAPATI